jgi:hypothetical protein
MEIENDMNNIKLYVVNARIPRDEYKVYYENQIKTFSSYFDENKISNIQFGKQDIRGGYSITLYFKNHCCTGLKYFGSMKELISFIEGFNLVKCETNQFTQYLKK